MSANREARAFLLSELKADWIACRSRSNVAYSKSISSKVDKETPSVFVNLIATRKVGILSPASRLCKKVLFNFDRSASCETDNPA